MNRNFFIFLIVIIFNYIINVYAENSYYICAVIRNENDKYYDDAGEEVQIAIDELVNERMNDIYTIIRDNRNTYLLENGEMDEILNELQYSTIKKRSIENKKLLFVNEKRSINHFRSQKFYKRSLSLTEEDELIAYDSHLVSHICPIKNYYAIRVYLSDAILGKVESLPNIKYCEKSTMSKNDSDSIFNSDLPVIEPEINSDSNFNSDLPVIEPEINSDSNSNSDLPITEPEINSDSNSNSDLLITEPENDSNDSNDTTFNTDPYYDLQFIKKEANWNSVGIQEVDKTSPKRYLLNYLSLISQSRYVKNNTKEFDYNYYYPGNAGQGIDIYIIDEGLDANYDDFDTYPGTDHERVVMCDGIFNDNKIVESETEEEKRFCKAVDEYLHGHEVAAAAGGKYVGTAKYANIHMLATSEIKVDELNALDYVKLKGKPHKTIINISRGGGVDLTRTFQDKFEELAEYGFIFVVSAGNTQINRCIAGEYYTGFNTTIKVAATSSILNEDGIEKAYVRASYSNFGPCVDIYAPGQTLYPLDTGRYELYGNRYNTTSGTSLSAPLTAGVIATLMSEHPEIEYTSESMRQLLIDLSIKDIISGIQSDDTPNRFINNGKKIVYSPVNVYEGCGASSAYSKCPEGSCCSSTNQCFEFGKYDILDQCLVEKGCQPDYGTCLSDKHFTPIKVTTSSLYITMTYAPKKVLTKSLNTNSISSTPTTTTNRAPKVLPTVVPEVKDCGPNIGQCTMSNPQNTAYIVIGCCNRNGYCGISSEDCSVNAGCQDRYGICLTNTLNATPTSKTVINNKSKIGQPCGKEDGSCIVKGYDGRTYEHISCCSKDGICGLSSDHCGNGCQSEFGACYASKSASTTLSVTTAVPMFGSMSIDSMESTINIPATASPFITESKTIMAGAPITENTPITSILIKSPKSIKYIIKTTTSTTTITKSKSIIESSTIASL